MIVNRVKHNVYVTSFIMEQMCKIFKNLLTTVMITSIVLQETLHNKLSLHQLVPTPQKECNADLVLATLILTHLL